MLHAVTLTPLWRGLLLLAACSVPPHSFTPRTGQPGQGVLPAVRDACDLAVSVARSTKGVTIERRTGSFRDDRKAITRRGCTVSVAGSFASLRGGKDVVERWRETFVRRGWQEELTYSADGPDGTAFALVSGGVICLFRGQWDGGDDTRPETPRADGYRGSCRCAPIGNERVRSTPR